MKKFRVLVLIFLLAIAAPLVLHHRAWARQAIQAQASGLRIVSPKPDDKLPQTFVSVQYQPLGPTAAGMPTYELRLDARDPVQTTDTTYTFNGLTAGSHDLIVQMVDANGTPIANTRSEVKFVTVNPPATTGNSGPGPTAALFPPLPSPPDLPGENGSLPLLSVIGFGILVGGVISALRTRPAHK
ncbi:MAG: hypothetical protein JO065_17250 [Acidobacteria bacterium]|nr:hypothetical protein [Acidobacteriota bacterium]